MGLLLPHRDLLGSAHFAHLFLAPLERQNRIKYKEYEFVGTLANLEGTGCRRRLAEVQTDVKFEMVIVLGKVDLWQWIYYLHKGIYLFWMRLSVLLSY